MMTACEVDEVAKQAFSFLLYTGARNYFIFMGVLFGPA
jgi:hypothetical protein